MKNSNHNAKLIGALFIGAVAGSAIGILIAPDSGRKTRKKLLSKGQDLTDSVKHSINGFLSDIKEEFIALKDKASTIMDSGKVKIEKGNLNS